MLEIIPYIILILLLILLELIQIIFAKSKTKKWILPILWFGFSLYMLVYFISFEISDTLGPVKNIFDAVSSGTLMMFPILNIPTLMFFVTNVIVQKIEEKM